MGVEGFLRVACSMSIRAIRYIFTTAMPPLTRLLLLIHRVYEGLHAFAVEAIGFRQIADVDAYFCVLPDVHH